MIKVALCSSDSTIYGTLRTALPKDFQITREPDYHRVLSLATNSECDVAIFDLKASYSDIHQRPVPCFGCLMNSGVRSIVLAGDDQTSWAIDLVKQGAYGYLSRNSFSADIERLLREAGDKVPSRREQIDEGCTNANRSSQIVGSSPEFQQIYAQINSVANLTASVLITGESGTGKELIARAIHERGGRSNNPFVAVSAGAIPETLLEAELFGHEKGAFTGSVGSRVGYFEQAGAGTIFLDEIGDLSAHAQVKLLRVLQEREFNRLGSSRPTPLKARFVFATHKDLEAMVAAGDFRHDLYYRINVVRIHSPALRDHPADIPSIALYYLREYARRYAKPATGLDPEVMAMLQAHMWPGNVRELENVIHRSVIHCAGALIRPKDLMFDFVRDNAGQTTYEEPRPAQDDSGSFESKMREYKLKLAEHAIRQHGGNKSEAARSLSISRAYLHRLIRPEGDNELSNEPAGLSNGKCVGSVA